MLVENSSFLIKDIPTFNPISQEYDRITWWSTEARKCIEGYWVAGKWMPGPLYYYVNFHHIEIEDKRTKGQVFGMPWLRDIDWELFLLYEECRGFSGFELDTKNTCDRKYGPEYTNARLLGLIDEKERDSKNYIDAREYLRRNHGKSLGKPLYANNAQNFISMQSRGGGKSYATAGLILHNFIFSGAIDYDLYLEQLRLKAPLSSDTILGAIDTKYSKPLIDKVKVGLDLLPGGTTYQGEYYPAPFFPGITGGWGANRNVESASGSKLYHRTFKDNPLAGNAGRPNLVALDEIGFFSNIEEAWGALTGSQASKQTKNMVIWCLGTGGLIGGSSALHAENIFRNPEEFGCISFDDVFENTGKIGYFVPITSTLNGFKEGPNKVTNETKAALSVEMDREKARKNPSKTAYQSEIINRPLVPSEAFLVLEGAYFPVVSLKDRLSEVVGNRQRWLDSSWKGELVYKDGAITWEDLDSAKPIRDFPLKKNADTAGAIELFEKPVKDENGLIPYHRYIIGVDTVDKDISTTDSLFSCIVFDRLTRRIVAEYTGRKDYSKQVYEIARRLAIYYHATIMYEQNLVGMFTHFEQKQCLYLLADTPTQLRNQATYREGTNTSKGVTATGKVNSEGRAFIKSWLLEELSEKNPDKIALKEIRSPAILKELIMWHKEGNFDRVSALAMIFWHDQTMPSGITEYRERAKDFTDNEYFDTVLGRNANDKAIEEMFKVNMPRRFN